jgi:hypothetical protein
MKRDIDPTMILSALSMALVSVVVVVVVGVVDAFAP